MIEVRETSCYVLFHGKRSRVRSCEGSRAPAKDRRSARAAKDGAWVHQQPGNARANLCGSDWPFAIARFEREAKQGPKRAAAEEFLRDAREGARSAETHRSTPSVLERRRGWLRGFARVGTTGVGACSQVPAVRDNDCRPIRMGKPSQDVSTGAFRLEATLCVMPSTDGSCGDRKSSLEPRQEGADQHRPDAHKAWATDFKGYGVQAGACAAQQVLGIARLLDVSSAVPATRRVPKVLLPSLLLGVTAQGIAVEPAATET